MKGLKSLTKYVVFSITAVLIFTIVSQIIFCLTGGAEYNTLTTCFFACFGGEILMCALIKIFKLKGDNNDNSDSDISSSGMCDNDDPNHRSG